METLLLLLPYIFSIVTGIVVSWCIYLCIVLTFFSDNIVVRSARMLKTLYASCTCVSSLGLLALLFIFTTFTSVHMTTILIIELLYMGFLYRITQTSYNTPYYELLNGFHERRNTPPRCQHGVIHERRKHLP